jgi:hypothetical protein
MDVTEPVSSALSTAATETRIVAAYMDTPARRAAIMTTMVKDLLAKYSDLDVCIRRYHESRNKN